MQGSFTETRILGVGSTDSVSDNFAPDSKVLARIIDSFRSKSTVKKTQIQLASKLRWDLFSKYWDWLQSKDYIKCIDVKGGKNDFMMTPMGNELFSRFLHYYDYLNTNNSIVS